MLPITVQFLVAMLAYGLNERMARKADYLREENRVLKEAIRAATRKTRIPLTDEQRRRLAAKGKALTPTEREECCPIVRPSTILAWFRQLVARKYDSTTGFATYEQWRSGVVLRQRRLCWSSAGRIRRFLLLSGRFP